MAFSDGSEASIITALRGAGHLTLSLVAEEGGVIIGHIAFSPLTIGDAIEGWFSLGPVSVEPERQRSGIGRRLVASGVAHFREHAALGIALIGDPQIYSRFGFESDGQLTYKDVPRNLVQRITLSGPHSIGEMRFVDAFEMQG